MRHVALLLSLIVCGCSGGSPASPSGGGSGGGGGGVSSVTVTVSSPLKVGESAQASATATLANGTTQPITSGWQTDAAAVATVSASGLVTGVANGMATISVASSGRTGQQSVRVVPDYDGRWPGTYDVTECTESGYFAEQRFCASVLGIGAPVLFTLTQSGTTVTGTFTLGSLAFPPVSPVIAADGSLPIAETTRPDTVQIVASWTLLQATPGTLTGTTRQRWTVNGRTGEGTLGGQLTGTMRGMSAATRQSARDRARHAPTLTDAMRAVF